MIVTLVAAALGGVAAAAPPSTGLSYGPALPPGFYGSLPDPFPGPEAPAGIRRLALVYSGCLLGETDPCG